MRSKPVRGVIVTIALYSFLLSIQLLGVSLKLFGTGFSQRLIQTTQNPFVGLFIGILVTSIIQSSSATTSIVVGFVAAQVLGISNAIPIVMGANIGTTVTNILVSLGHITRKVEFSRAFPAAVVHDLFNLLSVLVFFPLEINFHIIEKASLLLAEAFKGIGGLTVTSPLKLITSPLAHLIAKGLGSNPVIVMPLALILLFISLKFLVDMIRTLVSRRVELTLDKYLFGTPMKGFLFGFLLTAVIQSSSVATSLMVPLVGAGLLTLRKVYPYTLGTNIGTTLTAILASLATGTLLGIQIAFCHLLFNIFGILIWYPLRILPITLAEKLGGIITKKRFLSLVYVGLIFYLIPIIFIILTRR